MEGDDTGHTSNNLGAAIVVLLTSVVLQPSADRVAHVVELIRLIQNCDFHWYLPGATFPYRGGWNAKEVM
jgi:hypothetical protein